MADDLFDQNKKYLMQYRQIMRKVDRLEEKLYRLDCRKEQLSAAPISDEPKGGLSITLEDMLVQSEKINERINRLMIQARSVREEISDVIEALDNKMMATVIDMYFLERLSLYTIAEQLGYSFRQTNRYYSLGVRKCHQDGINMS